MPSVSEEQRKAACMALSAKLGKTAVSKLHPSAKSMYDSMSIKQLSDYCRSKVEG